MSNRMLSVLRQMGPKLLFRGAVLIAVLVGAGFLANHYKFKDILDYLDFSADGNAGWLHGKVAFAILGGLFTAIGGPRQAVSFFAAWFFGLADGFVVALAASSLGLLAGYGASHLFRNAANSFIRGRVDVAVRVWARHPFSLSLILRLLPVGSNLLANLAAGAASIPLVWFFAGSVIGYIPQTLVFSLMGSGVNVGSQQQVGLSIALFVVSIVLGLWVYARYRKNLRQD
ncbi:MAG: VTT domain-containing protein [Nitratireductor sp.]|nr:VTT domain-containing protein [Nitratireductor sp.]